MASWEPDIVPGVGELVVLREGTHCGWGMTENVGRGREDSSALLGGRRLACSEFILGFEG